MKEGLELPSQQQRGAGRSGYVNELGACESDRIGISLVRSSYGDSSE